MNAKNQEYDTLQSYFAQIKKYPLLTAEQEYELSRRIIDGDQAAIQELTQSNLRLVVKIARVYTAHSENLLDLVQEGNIGLMKAAEKYDFRKQVRFSTYASWWIRQSITRAITNKRRMIRLPHRKEDMLRRIKSTSLSLQQKLMRIPYSNEIAAAMGISNNEVVELLQFSGGTVSLHSIINDDSGTLMDVVEDYTYAPERHLMQEALQSETMHLLDGLRDRERRILLHRFALLGGERATLKCIGLEMGISPETVRQIEMRALRKLQQSAQNLQVYAGA